VIVSHARAEHIDEGEAFVAEALLESSRERRPPDPTVLPILGTVLSSLSIGTMIVLALTLDAPSHAFWVAPLPFTFLGVGLIAYHYLLARPGR
jgi:hypothetical protein